MTTYRMQFLDWSGDRRTVDVRIAETTWDDGTPAYCADALGTLGYGKRANDPWSAMQILALNHGRQFLTAEAV